MCGNLPGFLYHFSRTKVERSELATISHLNFRKVMRGETRQVFWTLLVKLQPKLPNRNLFRTFDCIATVSCQNFQTMSALLNSGTCDNPPNFCVILVALKLKVPNWNFWPQCNYFPSELSNSNAWRNPPGFLNPFSQTTAQSSKLELIQNIQPWCGYFPI